MEAKGRRGRWGWGGRRGQGGRRARRSGGGVVGEGEDALWVEGEEEVVGAVRVKGRSRPGAWVEGEEGAVGAVRANGRSRPGAPQVKARRQAAGQREQREGAARPKGRDAARGQRRCATERAGRSKQWRCERRMRKGAAQGQGRVESRRNQRNHEGLDRRARKRARHSDRTVRKCGRRGLALVTAVLPTLDKTSSPGRALARRGNVSEGVKMS